MINQKENKCKQNIGSSLLLPAYGRVGQGQHSLAVYFAKRNTKNCGGGKARAGREFIFPTPLFLPAPPERNFQKSKSGFSSKKVRILTKRYRQFSKFGFWVIVIYNAIIKIESGTIQNPTIDTLSKIAKALDVKVDDLIKK